MKYSQFNIVLDFEIFLSTRLFSYLSFLEIENSSSFLETKGMIICSFSTKHKEYLL